MLEEASAYTLCASELGPIISHVTCTCQAVNALDTADVSRRLELFGINLPFRNHQQTTSRHQHHQHPHTLPVALPITNTSHTSHNGPSAWRNCASPPNRRCEARTRCSRTSNCPPPLNRRRPRRRTTCCCATGCCSPGTGSVRTDGQYCCVRRSSLIECSLLMSPCSGVAVGSSIGHAVGGWFSGGSSAPAEASPQSTDFAAQHQDPAASTSQMQQASGPCANDVNTFRKCMDDNQGSLTICGWYLDQLKACQAAAGQY